MIGRCLGPLVVGTAVSIGVLVSDISDEIAQASAANRIAEGCPLPVGQSAAGATELEAVPVRLARCSPAGARRG